MIIVCEEHCCLWKQRLKLASCWFWFIDKQWREELVTAFSRSEVFSSYFQTRLSFGQLWLGKKVSHDLLSSSDSQKPSLRSLNVHGPKIRSPKSCISGPYLFSCCQSYTWQARPPWQRFQPIRGLHFLTKTIDFKYYYNILANNHVYYKGGYCILYSRTKITF